MEEVTAAQEATEKMSATEENTVSLTKAVIKSSKLDNSGRDTMLAARMNVFFTI